MKHLWSEEELVTNWSISFDEYALIEPFNKMNQIGFIYQLKHYIISGMFPDKTISTPKSVLDYICDQLDTNDSSFYRYNLAGRTARRHREEILNYLGIVRFDETHKILVTEMLISNLFPHGVTSDRAYIEVFNYLRHENVDPPTEKVLSRLVKSVYARFEKELMISISNQLDQTTSDHFSSCLKEDPDSADYMSFSLLKSDPGHLGLETTLNEIKKLKFIEEASLPVDGVGSIHPKIRERLYKRIFTENSWEVKRHPKHIKESLLFIFFYERRKELIDNLVELLILLIGKLGKRAEKKVEKTILKDVKRVYGKNKLLMKIADASLHHPNGKVRDVVYPVVNQKTLRDILNEYKSSGKGFREEVHNVIKSSYSTHYRKMVPKILDTLNFQSNNESYRPIIDAITWLRSGENSRRRFFDIATDDLPIKDIIKSKWYDIVVENDNDGDKRISRINYEISLLEVLRDKLRCKEIWVEGADKYRNPDEDVPMDFYQNKSFYFNRLGVTEDSKSFTTDLKEKMNTALESLNSAILDNKHVKLKQSPKGKNIVLSPLEKQAEPKNINKLKGQIQTIWPMTSLLDVLKETDLRVGFSDSFKSQRSSERIDRDALQKRLLLTLYGLGTNTGLKRISASNEEVSFKELRHMKQLYLNQSSLRKAISDVVNATFRIRNPSIWGEGTTSCASDSKKFGSWDQNLMTEWHIRYGGRGVMIYWHVEKKSTCIYSQLKKCSSSEVANMIEGVLRHCTDMSIQKQYVDTHGQSEVAFAFCHLLGFNLMPRLKNIASQKLYLPETGSANKLKNLKKILSKPIKWELILQQYDEMIKYTSALLSGTAEPEAILKRFTRNNATHPTYKALAELGKVMKTIFLCQYLQHEEIRREIHEGLNVIENWNSANSFIFFGKGGEISTNRLAEQELCVLSLHLLQMCLVYVNTLMIQQVTVSDKWKSMLTTEDYRALTPLIYSHVNPYGTFELNMEQRLSLIA